ncbi:MAG: PadR family transcriptional regulator [Oscillospiraceae bacterium]
MLDPQMKKGLLEMCVLSVLGRGDSYGYRIVGELSECIEISESTLYPILRRLETAGSLTAYTVQHNNRLRKFYSITPKGREQLRDFAMSWREVIELYEFIKGGTDCDEA